MDDEVYVIDSSSGGSAAPSSRASLSGSDSFADSADLKQRPVMPDPFAKPPPAPARPMTVTEGTCTERDFAADDEADAAIHREIMRLATLLPANSQRGHKAGRKDAAHNQTEHRQAAFTAGPTSEWRATLASLKRPRSPAESSEYEETLPVKRESSLEATPQWADTLATVVDDLHALAGRGQPTTCEQAPSSAPVCLLTSPGPIIAGSVASYSPNSVASSVAPVSTLEAEARLIIGRERGKSLLPLYKELLQLRKQRAHTVLGNAAMQQVLLGTQQALLEEVELTCRRDMHAAASAFRRKCTSDVHFERSIQSLEESVHKMESLRASIETHRVPAPATDREGCGLPATLIPNEQRQPGKGAAAYLEALEDALTTTQQQNASLTIRLEQLAATNRQLQERCAASARDVVHNAQEAGWVRKEVMLKLLATRNQSLEAVAHALGWRVASCSSDQIVLMGGAAQHEGQRLSIDLSEKSISQESPTSSAADLGDAKAEDGIQHSSEEDPVSASNGIGDAVPAPSVSPEAGRDAFVNAEGDARIDQADTASAHSTRSQAAVRSFPSSDASTCSALLEDPAAVDEENAPPSGGAETGAAEEDYDGAIDNVTPHSLASRQPSDAELHESPAHSNHADEEDELMDRTDETLVASMSGTENTSRAEELDRTPQL